MDEFQALERAADLITTGKDNGRRARAGRTITGFPRCRETSRFRSEMTSSNTRPYRDSAEPLQFCLMVTTMPPAKAVKPGTPG